MKIHVFTSDDPELPAGDRHHARIRCEMVGQGGKAAMRWHPVLISAPTPEEARRKAQEFWHAELVRFRAIRDPKKRAAKRADAATGNADVIDFEAMGEPAPVARVKPDPAEVEEAV